MNGGLTLPAHLPNKPRAKAIRAEAHQETRARKTRPLHPIETIDWLALWALSIGFSAIVLAALVFFGGRDASGASVILAGAAGVIALVLRFSDAPADRR